MFDYSRCNINTAEDHDGSGYLNIQSDLTTMASGQASSANKLGAKKSSFYMPPILSPSSQKSFEN